MSLPLVSVVIPTYNRAELLKEAIASVRAQTFDDWEIVIVDDGSTDNTPSVVMHAIQSEPRIRYVWQKNAERAVARNRGIFESRGEFIAFLDSDDLWLPSKLEKQTCLLGAERADCCYSGWDTINGVECSLPNQQLPSGDLFSTLLKRCLIGSMTPVVRRKCFDVVGSFNEDRRLLCFEDWEMWTRISSRYHWVIVPEVLGRYRLHAGNTQHAADVGVDELRINLMERYMLTSTQRRDLREYAAARTWHWATKLHQSEPKTSLRMQRHHVTVNPLSLLNRHVWGLAVKSALNLVTMRGFLRAEGDRLDR